MHPHNENSTKLKVLEINQNIIDPNNKSPKLIIKKCPQCNGTRIWNKNEWKGTKGAKLDVISGLLKCPNLGNCSWINYG